MTVAHIVMLDSQEHTGDSLMVTAYFFVKMCNT